ncbi:unnamed protein product [Parnassius apollo]|uniref:(apollo) hypothetical protein n=1 Tax=Parnassius apollo TaxID=110799 RepID=A0A8S3WFE3_PARAO|nr:unnamed protein product [Parnassius apollo]
MIEFILRELKLRDTKYAVESKYGWLLSRRKLNFGAFGDWYLDRYRTLIDKMTSESCVAVAVKLDKCVEENFNITTGNILLTLQKLLEEQLSIQMIQRNIQIRKQRSINRNRVRPELIHDKSSKIFFLSSNVQIKRPPASL